MADISKFVAELTYESCKVALYGNDLLTREDISMMRPLSEVKKEVKFSSKYRMHEKPSSEELKAEFESEDWDAAIKMLQEPKANPFVPEDISTIVNPKKRERKNADPNAFEIAKGVNLYHQLDHVYLKPKTIIDIFLRIKQPEKRSTDEGKSVCFLKTPADFALYSVLEDCVDSAITAKVGYEAQLANCTYIM